MRPRELIVVGHGMVGHRLVEEVRDRDAAGEWRITVLAEEPRPAYDRVNLSSYFDGAGADELRLPGATFDGDDLVELRLGDPVTAVDRDARTVTTAAGTSYRYDALVLATGSRPFVPPVPGRDLPGCFVYRTIADLDAISAAAGALTGRGPGGRAIVASPGGPARSGGAVRAEGADHPNRARDPEGAGRPVGVVIGGGLLGLEAANALRLLGLTAHVVEMAPHLMPAQVDEGGGALLDRLLDQLGVMVHCGTSVTAVHSGGDGRAARVELADGTVLDTALVVFAAGIRPRDELARAAGLETGQRGGIVTGENCRSGDPGIYAIGECACVNGRVYGLAAPGYAMAETVADRLLGGDATVGDPETSTKLKLLGVDVASFGDAHGTTPGALPVVLSNPAGGTYAKLVVSDDAQTLLGGILVGDASAYAALRPLTGRPLPGDPVALIAPQTGGDTGKGARAAGVAALGGDALICSCQAVPKQAIMDSINCGAASTVADIKACTRAGTGCGSCAPTLKQLLEIGGITQSKALCEHFEYSRAELFEIGAATGIRTFSGFLAARGHGRGCDICKPAIASVLAALASASGQQGHILDREQAALQDTNDHFLANLQRNGTYSVIPRIPGGEISPGKLMVIAEVAREFGLYTKITGGQRIDMFGARVEQLPRIWRRLVDAGFESGHAYGKAVRTVKSCVGSTWCRYGVQDSVAMAIELELRYRGLRSPHKIKAGVSGCARECAEARGKDFGVIATETGWNLFVGGNGGFRPRHADLLVSDVDHDTLITLIDRFLMFYIRTADRLQRTAGWIEAMDGGLNHLRSVIMDDSIGICGELDAAMARHIRSYADEWRGVLEDPERLARFVSFVNAPGVPDPTVEFAVERGQPVPARARKSGPVDLGMPAGSRR